MLKTVDGDFIAAESARDDGGRAAEFNGSRAQRVKAEDARGGVARRRMKVYARGLNRQHETSRIVHRTSTRRFDRRDGSRAKIKYLRQLGDGTAILFGERAVEEAEHETTLVKRALDGAHRGQAHDFPQACELLVDSSTPESRTLTPLIMVRIQVLNQGVGLKSLRICSFRARRNSPKTSAR